MVETGNVYTCGNCNSEKRRRRSIPDDALCSASSSVPSSADPVCAVCSAHGVLDSLIACFGSCGKLFHRACVSLTQGDFELLGRCRNINFTCDDCMLKNGDLGTSAADLRRDFLAALEKLKGDMLQSFERRAVDLSKELELTVGSRLGSLVRDAVAETAKCAVPGVRQVQSYAKIAQNRTKPAVLIQPKKAQPSSVTKLDILQNIDPVASNLQLSKVKDLKDGAVLIGCSTPNDIEVFKHAAEDKLSDTYLVKEFKGINPRIKVVGMAEKLSDDAFLRLFKSMNRHLISEAADLRLLKLWATKKQSDVYQALVQLDRQSYDNVMRSGSVFIGYNSCAVFDAVEVMRCFKCSRFNHSSKNCNADPCCPRCSGAHEVNICKSTALSCVNCVALKKSGRGNIDTAHAAWDSSCLAHAELRRSLRDSLLSVQ